MALGHSEHLLASHQTAPPLASHTKLSGHIRAATQAVSGPPHARRAPDSVRAATGIRFPGPETAIVRVPDGLLGASRMRRGGLMETTGQGEF